MWFSIILIDLQYKQLIILFLKASLLYVISLHEPNIFQLFKRINKQEKEKKVKAFIWS